ncbi:MAG: oligoendopeptidase F [Clostridia bacterium]|nr:oligoendopeptidase F [Clostridia bacterium]
MQRDQVKKNRKWKTEDIYSSDEEWEKSFEQLSAQINFSQYAGKLSDKKTLLKFLKENDKFSEQFMKLGTYAHMKHDEDTRVSKYTAYYSKVYSLDSAYNTEVAFFEPEMAGLDEEYLNSLLNDSDFSDYDYMIKSIIKGKPHVISEEQEKIVALAGESLNTFSEIFSMIDSADLPLGEVTYNGKTEKLTHGLYSIALHNGTREERKEVYEKYYAAYQSLLNTITANYYGSIKSDVFLSKVYKFDSCLEHALFAEDVDKKVYDNLIHSVKSNLSSMHRYIADRKKILGYDKLYFYDVYAPLVSDVDVKMDYDEAYDYVIKGLAPLGKEYQALLKKGHDERWIDVEETEGKKSGAYSIGSYGVHPYVLLNYQQTTNDIFTIAHEMGHSLHTYFSCSNQPYAKSSYKIFVAEVASTVNEVLLLKYMLADAKDEQLKKYLLNYYLDTIRATLHRQTMFAEFEYNAHTMAEKGQPLTTENLCEMYAGLGKEYYGNDIEHDYNISCEWMRVPHFYRAFYVYKYATGITAAINIAKRILTEGQPAVDDYFKFLSAGSSDDPVSLLKLAGVDLSCEEPFAVAMAEFDETLNEFEKLMGI